MIGHLLLIFIATMLLEIAWVFYTIHTVALNQFRAAAYCAAISAMNAICTIIYVHDGTPGVIVYSIGAFIGTYGAVYWAKRRQKA